MDKALLEGFVAQGMSLDAIGERVGKHPSTVSYWLKKHRLTAAGAARHAPKGPISREDLVALVEDDLPLREIARRLDRSATVVRYWLDKYNIPRGRYVRRVIPGGPKKVSMPCGRHGQTEFVLEGRGSYRCGRCRAEAVARRRRVVKRILVEEAGGSCAICGYSRCQQALQFHHVDPATKSFHLGHSGHSRSLVRSREEAQKCVLLCATCHAEVEAGITEMPLNSLVEADPG